MTINQYCKNIRENVLKMSLLEVANNDKALYQNLWQFEHGNNNRFANIYYYFNLLDKDYRHIFKTTIWELLTWE
jgi:hypothetical protein